MGQMRSYVLTCTEMCGHKKAICYRKKRRNKLQTSASWSLSTDLQFVLFPVDDHSGDLLVHKYENGDQQCRECGCQVHPPGVLSERRDQPAPLGISGLEREEDEERVSM